MFAGSNFPLGTQIGRVGDAAFPTVDHDWHNSPMSGASASKHEADYHWPLTNYDWNAPDIGMENEAEDVSVTVTGFGGTFMLVVVIVCVESAYLVFILIFTCTMLILIYTQN